MRSTLLAAGLVLAGCKPAEPLNNGQNDAAPAGNVAVAAPRVPEPTKLSDLWTAYLVDAAGAPLRYGETPRVHVVAERVEKSGGGYVVTRVLDGTAGPGTAKLFFPAREGAKLAGKTGELIVVRGRVQTATARLFMMTDCRVD